MRRRLRPSRAVAVAVLVGLFGAQAAAAGEHTRVVLDLSASMQRNDPHRVAVLATSLLFDLAAPNPTLDDSFEIMPFDRDWRWAAPADPPPAATRARIRVGHEQRDALAAELARLAYDARMTYFYPGLAAAVGDLRATPGGDHDVRTIVLVTDGVPEEPTREREAALIRDEIVPALEEHRIRLYVLAFSAEALAHRDFLEAMVRGPRGALGEVFLDPDGSGLVAHMLSLFGHSFGYTSAAAQVPGAATLDLDGAGRPDKVAVVVHAPRSSPPRLGLTPPTGGPPIAGVVSAREASASYSLVWVLSPSAGRYAFSTDAPTGEVAVLRPAQLELEVLPAPPRTQTERTMAETPLALRVRVRSRLGGDPGPVDLSFRPLGELLSDPGKGTGEHAWRGDRGAPAAGAGAPTPEGRIYDVAPVFEPNRRQPGEVYAGYLELEARRGAALVGSRLGQHAHRVEVHPHLALAPLPLEAYVADRALGRYESGCTRFSLTLAAGGLPHPDRPRYSLRAVVAPADPGVFDRALRRAVFTLDGVPLGLAGRSSGTPGWGVGVELERDLLLGEHELCVQMGEPTEGDPDSPVELPVALTLLEAPYDDFDVVRPFRIKLLVAAPPPLDRWRSLLALGALALVAAAALWHLRDRPSLPRDLRYAIGREPSTLAGGSPGAVSPLHRILALTGEHPLLAEGGETAAWLVPDREELFRLRPARGRRLLAEDGKALPLDRGLASLEVRRRYRLEGDGGRRYLRLEYAAPISTAAPIPPAR